MMSISTQAQLSDKIEDCYDNNSSHSDASYCADMNLVRVIRSLRRRIKQLEGGSNHGATASTFFRCDASSDPKLYRTVVGPEGSTLRNDLIQTFTNGNDDQERINCQNELFKKTATLAIGTSVICSCSNSGDPSLNIEIINSEFETVKNLSLNTFTVGSNPQERRDCRNMKNELPICN